MSNKLTITTLIIADTTAFVPAYADDGYISCSVEVAVSSPPVPATDRVIFNVSNERGTNKSKTLNVGSEPYTFTNLICSGLPYSISATTYSAPANTLLPSTQQVVGQCVLKAGAMVMDEENDSISVVFPQDFNCGL